MIKTLHITSVIAAVLAAGLFVLPVFFGFRNDENIEKFLAAPSTLDRFRADAGNTTRTGQDKTSPLVTQAATFALILNPPPPPVAVKDHTPKLPKETSARDIPKSITAKFKVVATSYNQSRPEESLALVDEPGKGLHWVRQADVVGNLTIEVQDGMVLAKAGSKIQTLAVSHKPQASLLAGASDVPFPIKAPAPTPRTSGKRSSIDRNRPRTGKTGNTGNSGSQAGVSTTISEADATTIEEQKAKAAKIFAELEAMARNTGSSKTSSGESNKGGTTVSGGADTTAEGTGVTGGEAGKIGDLGKELKNITSARERAKLLRQRRAERSKKLRERIEKARRSRQK